MSPRHLTAIFAAILAVSFSIETAQARGHKGPKIRGIFEAPMVDMVNDADPTLVPAEVLGSEGKIGRNGEFKVEIPRTPAGTYRVCLFHDTGSHFLGEVVLNEDGELKLEGDLTMSPTNPLVVSGAVLVHPDFRVFVDGISTDGCTGTPEYRSGLMVDMLGVIQ